MDVLRLACRSLMILALLAAPAVAQDEEPPAGSFAFRMKSISTPLNFHGGVGFAFNAHVGQLGTLLVAADGTVTGSRTLVLPTNRLDGVGGGIGDYRHEFVEQELAGTLDLDETGRGVLELTVTPGATWTPTPGAFVPHAWVFDGTETWRVVSADGGRRLEILAKMNGTRLEEPTQRVEVLFTGQASASKTDASIRAEMETSRAQLCEVIRLLHVPQGQRSSDSGVTEDVCGTSYAWNEDGSRSRR